MFSNLQIIISITYKGGQKIRGSKNTISIEMLLDSSENEESWFLSLVLWFIQPQIVVIKSNQVSDEAAILTLSR